MKKTVLFFILIICSVAAYSQEAVGKVNVKTQDMAIEIVFYDNEVSMDTVIEVMKSILTVNTKGLRSVDSDDYGILVEELSKRLELVDFSKINLEWGYMTDFSTLVFNFSYQKKEYFVIATSPDERYWFFENLGK